MLFYSRRKHGHRTLKNWKHLKINFLHHQNQSYHRRSEDILRSEIAKRDERIKAFEQAIDNEIVVSHLGVFNPGDDPKVALNKLQCYAEDLGALAQDQLKQQAAEIARLKAQLKSMERVELEEPNWSNNNEV